jgi:hypothetical protein
MSEGPKFRILYRLYIVKKKKSLINIIPSFMLPFPLLSAAFRIFI